MKNLKKIIEDISRGIKHTPMKLINREDAIRMAIAMANEGDIVCIVGKGPERYTIKNGTYYPFDEREIIMSALKERGLCE